MGSFVRNCSVEKLIALCSRRPAEEAAWQEFVRRFHQSIQSSVSNVLALITKNEHGTKQGLLEDDLVQDVYRRLTENDSAALKAVSCTGAKSMKNYLLLISIKVVQDHLRAATSEVGSRFGGVNTEIPFELCSLLSHKGSDARTGANA